MIVSSWVVEELADRAFLASDCVTGETVWDSTFDGLVGQLPRPCTVEVSGVWLRVPVQGEVHEVERPVLVERYKKVHGKLLGRLSGGKIRRFSGRDLKKEAEILSVYVDDGVDGVLPRGLRERMRVENENDSVLQVSKEQVARRILRATSSIRVDSLPVARGLGGAS